MRRLLAGFVMILAVPLPAQALPGATATAPEIVVTGSGEVRIPPDRAQVTIAIVTRAATAAQAGRLNVERIRPVIEALRRLGLPDSAVRTSEYSVSEEFESDRPAKTTRPRTYVARNAVRATLGHLADLGRVIDTALAAGATEIGDITFASSAEPEARQRAIALAVAHATRDATAAATAGGGRLGPIVEIVIDPEADDLRLRALRLSSVVVSGGGTGIAPDDLTISARARVRFVFVRAP